MALSNLTKRHLNKHVQDLYDLSMQFNDLKSLLYSNINIILGNALINIAQRSLFKPSCLSFKARSQKIVLSFQAKFKT